jgi:hypothetical protein
MWVQFDNHVTFKQFFLNCNLALQEAASQRCTCAENGNAPYSIEWQWPGLRILANYSRKVYLSGIIIRMCSPKNQLGGNVGL